MRVLLSELFSGVLPATAHPAACRSVIVRSVIVRAGKSSGGLKEVADAFKEGMDEVETGVSKDGGDNAIKSAAVEEKEA